MKIELPIEKHPVIQSYLHYAFPLSIIMTKPYFMEWIANNFIQLIYEPDDRCPLDFNEILYNYWPCLHTSRLYKTHFDRHAISSVDFVRRELESGTYATAWIDMYYVEGHAYYQQHHGQHGALIYGADDEAACFLAMMYRKDGTYGEQAISYDAFAKAVNGPCSEGQAVYIDFITLNIHVALDYDFYRIQHKLRCYLFSKSYDVDDLNYHKYIGITDYGVGACKRLQDYLNTVTKSKLQEIDLRLIAVFTEHKTCMMSRINMILKKDTLPGYPFTQEDRSNLCQKAQQLLMLSVKYNISKKLSLLDRISALIDNILEEENQMLLPIIQFERDPATVPPRLDGKAQYKPLSIL